MRKIILYIAVSLDGYVADDKGGVDWINGDNSDNESKGTYPEFYDSIDTVILGYKTYNQIVSELSPNKWVYEDKKSYVVTHRDIESTDKITFTSEKIEGLIEKLTKEDGQNIWICGGASIANMLIEKNLIDMYRISIIPTILGNGIPLFSEHLNELKLKLVSTENNNGIVELNYERR